MPGWHADKTFIAQGWIAVALVIFGQWKPGRTMIGAYLVAFISRLTLDLQAPRDFFGIANPFFYYQPSTFFLGMLPFALVILVLIVAAREANAEADRRAGRAGPALRARRARPLTHGQAAPARDGRAGLRPIDAAREPAGRSEAGDLGVDLAQQRRELAELLERQRLLAVGEGVVGVRDGPRP